LKLTTLPGVGAGVGVETSGVGVGAGVETPELTPTLLISDCFCGRYSANYVHRYFPCVRSLRCYEAGFT